MNIREWQERYAGGEFDADDRDVQVAAGWFDWFCEDSKLAGKTKELAKVVTRLKDGGKLDLEEMHVFFMNCMPAEDFPLYDSLRIADDEHNVFVCDVDDKRRNSKWVIYDIKSWDGKPDHPAAELDSAVQVAKWLNSPVEERRTSTLPLPEGAALMKEIKAAATADAKEKFGEEVEFFGVQRKHFRYQDEADLWLSRELENAPRGTLLLAVGDVSTLGYAL